MAFSKPIMGLYTSPLPLVVNTWQDLEEKGRIEALATTNFMVNLFTQLHTDESAMTPEVAEMGKMPREISEAESVLWELWRR